MSDSTLIFNDHIHWPEGITEQIFLDQYWQKQPLLIRQAFPDFDTPLPADELAGLALEEDIAARLITRDTEGGFSLEHGPFSEERLTSLPTTDWSLLVTDIEKHLPEFAAFLQPFRFIPDWRIDDLMISHAPHGASVGAHVDEYDVFLLQGSGVRRWSIDARSSMVHEMRSDGDLKILANFNASDTWDLVPGDMLYLPPGMAHHGVARGDSCTTWSIGFRAPHLPEFTARLAELISEQMSPVRYTDAQLTPSRPGEISQASVARFKTIWTQAVQLDDAVFSTLLGRFLTESNLLPPADDHQTGFTPDAFFNASQTLRKAPFSRFAWTGLADGKATLFVDGEAYPCSSRIACELCANNQFVELSVDESKAAENALILHLIEAGCLLPLD